MAEGVDSGRDEAEGQRWQALLRDALPGVAAAVGTPQFAGRLIESLHPVLEFEWWMVMVYRQHANPEMLCENFTGSWRARGLTAYVGGFYILDPFYIMSHALDRPEVCRLGDIAPDGFLESEYHRAHYASGRIGDEVNYLWPLEGGATLAVSLERSENSAEFSDADVGRMETVQPLLYALACRHWSMTRQWTAPPAGLELGRLVQDAAANFGRKLLTPRECEVVKLVLRGFSSKSISHALGISPGTVKVHRENIYAKLGISSQAELFNLFIASVIAPAEAAGAAGADPGRAA
jgi:DNA-binding CsgD family transcriptional regulator